jgi:hypothetical protein
MASIRKLILAACVLLCFAGASLAADIALTSAGQSPDAMMVRVVLKKLGVEADYDPLMKPEAFTQKILIVVIGGSSKGLGAAGIDKDQEIARLTALLETASEKGAKILAMHVGGEGRRGKLSDEFITVVAPSAAKLIVVDGGDADGIFANIAKEKKIPVLGAPNVSGVAGPLKAILTEWGVATK